VLFPLLGVQELGATAACYGRDIIFLFLGGFLLALGVERSGLHQRLALWIVSHIGASPPRLVLGTLLACGVLSMWINSTAAVLVMLPIAFGLVKATDGDKELGAVLALAVAYGATIGGMATPVGTPPNLVMMAMWRQEFPDEAAIGFGQWMLFGVPYALLFLLFTWLLLTRSLFRLPGTATVDRGGLRDQLRALGPMSRDERWAGLVFMLVAALWITGDPVAFSESLVFPGWRRALGLAALGDPTVGMLGGLLLFLIRAKGEKRALLDWDFAQQRIPWGVVLLIGSGFAIAGGIDATGLSATIGSAVSTWRMASDIAQIGVVATGVTLLSELGSNTAVASLVLPILARTAEAWGMAPVTVMVPAALAASCGFMLPIASPMQAIVFSSGHLTVKQMVKAGIWMDLMGVLLLMGLWAMLGAAVFG
jgi:sodium-dependent dicarboxylate transporter 2/3/5